MLILSFDIGIKNLAYCLLDSEDNTILDWNVLNCGGNNVLLNIIQELDNLEYLREADVILLEKQPSFNPKMRNISTVLYVYFTLRIKHDDNKKVEIIFYSPKYKLLCCNIKIEHTAKTKYVQNKNLAIAHTRHLLNSHKLFFENNKKKDDLADCFLQGISYTKYFYIK